ncbi:MAG: diaminopimelate epimerase [Candidatus Pristimantibacillus lignocellulolyticus]|uniref:Diaminopimelate epimerase n=1 Tax=Candidatus Pristimantibacillus lignocellulolyticus TaxID=2994561 RepID=A0A9J6ZAS4_9BACL|nr:MAG: diaminopimelate epimerase [Candidatus Pristimantibacillus lignocellulolyticus]
MEFTKMHGLGNDFVIVYGEQQLPANASELALQVCNRFFGIGADGLVYILPSDKADFRMRIMNSDGTEAEQCGNAIRCVSKYVYDNNLIQSEEITIETLGAGVQKVQLMINDGSVEKVRVDMGAPILHGLTIPTTIDSDPVIEHPIEANGQQFTFTAVSMGNPHCVIPVEDAATLDYSVIGPILETHELFPKKINVEFITVYNRSHIEMRVWERGAGPTLACGTGACATLVASALRGVTDREATISLKGGDLYIEWNSSDNHVYMTGPAEEVFRGKFE